MRYDFADLSLDMDARELRRGGAPLRLSPKAMDLLAILVSAPHHVIPKAELYDRLWPDIYVVEGNLHVLIREIRNVIGDKQRLLIRTAHRSGYSCAVSVREVSVTDPPQRQETTGVVHTLRHGTQEYRLNEGENLIGREPSAQLFLSSASVSRRHAIIHITGDRATITDLGSKNGTFIGDRPVLDKALLADGSIVKFGSVEVLYQFCFHAGPTETLRAS